MHSSQLPIDFPRTLLSILSNPFKELAHWHRLHTGSFAFDGFMKWKLAPRRSYYEPTIGSRLVSLMCLALLLKVADELRVMEEKSSHWHFLFMILMKAPI